MKDILELAREAGFEIDCASLEWHRRIERFAALVRAQTLEEAAQKCESLANHEAGSELSWATRSCAAAIRALTKEKA